ncbi:MAG: KAP family NTPase [Muribaculaceae bacterium]|nr:KAP family NTPase [Muribaculaceae bacterium]
MERITSVSDIPLIKDPNDFGTKRYVDGLVEFIKYSVSPLTIALQGEWGSGKTSLMNRLYGNLCGDDSEFVGITINTWEYSMLSTPEETVIKIIERLVKALSKGEKQQNALEKFTKWAKLGGGVAFRAVREAAKAAGAIAGSILIESFVKGDAGTVNSNSDDVSLSDLKETLEIAVNDHICRGKKGVLVFVDDLDRLNPPVAVEILELLKNIFSLKGCIFILAIDYEVVVKGLEPKFGKLTDKNEREFRSFFDKIIQVPFSLPVNNYHPESFLIKMLREINYISDKDSLVIDRLSDRFTNIVEKTVGKNPRAIKRLINSLSLINCISKIKEESPASESLISPESISGKIINFAVIAMQISYPRIYNVLMEYPDFKAWDWHTARRFKAVIPENNESETTGNETIWEKMLSAICETDTYLKAHESDIKEVIELISKEIAENNKNEDPGKVLSEFLKRSSVTGVGGLRDATETNYPQIMRKLHSNVIAAMSNKHKDWKLSDRRVTNSGGFNLYINDKHFQSKLSPCELNNGRVTIRLEIPSSINVIDYPNIKRLLDLGFDDAIKDPGFIKLLDNFDAVITPLLNKEWFKGLSLRSRLTEQWLKNGNWENIKRFFRDTTFDFTLPMSSGFEQDEVIDAMVAVHEAVWNLHLNAKNLK